MNEIILLYSKFPKKKESTYISFDVIKYNETYYAGFELFKNFNNYLAGSPHLSVIKFNHVYDAEKYFNNIEF